MVNQEEIENYKKKYSRKPYICKYCDAIMSSTNKNHHNSTEKHALHKKIYYLKKNK